MSVNTVRELQYARGMVERRMDMAKSIGRASSRREAEDVFRSVCGAVKEVTKHRRNILNEIDDEGAKHALDANGLLSVVTVWQERSAEELAGWGVSEAEVARIEREVMGDYA